MLGGVNTGAKRTFPLKGGESGQRESENLTAARRRLESVG
jgi:hypothetical protein